MGYAQIAGLPPVYGLYGSVVPVLVYALFTGSKQFVFGVDAMPAALTGTLLMELGIEAGSSRAMELVPVLTLAVAAWLFLFYLIRAGRVVRYISSPVMGGFISGIGLTIILMQLPKLFGGVAGTGEVFVLADHILGQLSSFHWLSLILGAGTVVLILAAKKLRPEFPMPVVMILLGAMLTRFFHVDRLGVKILPSIEGGLPRIILPKISLFMEYGEDIAVSALTIALVIMAQTLLATSNYARKYDEKLDNNREVLSFAMSNLSAVFFGCSPLNGSVSRAGIADQYKARSQWMSVTAAFTMLLVLLFGTGLLELLPVPILTGIVIAALMGILEPAMAKTLWKTDRSEWFIFMGAFLGVLVFGTLYGVIIGVVLSFADVIRRSVAVPKAFLGVIPGQEGFYDMARYYDARPLKGVLIYRFSGNLFFANIDTLEGDIEQVVEAEKDTPEPIGIIVVDARGIGSIDTTAAERLLKLYRKYEKEGVRFYLTEHPGTINDQLRLYGAAELIRHGVVRRSITLALRAAGVHAPYEYAPRLDAHILFPDRGLSRGQMVGDEEIDSRLAELEWAFGADAGEVRRKIAEEWTRELEASGDTSVEHILEVEKHIDFGRLSLTDEEAILQQVEGHLKKEDMRGAIHHRIEVVEEKIRKL